MKNLPLSGRVSFSCRLSAQLQSKKTGGAGGNEASRCREKYFALFAHFFIADCTNIFISFKALSGGKKNDCGEEGKGAQNMGKSGRIISCVFTYMATGRHTGIKNN